MEFVLSVLGAAARGLLQRLDDWPPMLSLAGLSVLTGIGMLWVFGRLSDQEAIRAVKRELAACLYEIRLFADEPSLIWRAQKHLLTRNLRYLALMLRPALALTAPMVLLLIHLDAFFGRAPIPPGQAALVKVQLERAAPLEAALETPAGVAVETLPVRLPEQWQLVWRIRPSREMVGTLRLRVHDRLYEKQLVAGAPPRYLTSQRVRSFWSWVAHSGEARLPEGPVRAIEIVYPPAKLSWGPLQFHWLVWFLLLSLAAAWALRGPFDVTL